MIELAHIGKDGGRDLAAPNLHFAAAAMPNHVPGATGNSSGMSHFRITAIGNGSGGTIQVDYSPTECTATTVAGITPSNNPYRCYPTGDGHGMWFHNYRVTKVSLRDDMASPDRGVQLQLQHRRVEHHRPVDLRPDRTDPAGPPHLVHVRRLLHRHRRPRRRHRHPVHQHRLVLPGHGRRLPGHRRRPALRAR